MTTLTLTRKSGVTVSFEPKGAKVTVTTVWPDGGKAEATVPVVLARRVWATEVKGGAVKAAPKAAPEFYGPPPGTWASIAWEMAKSGLMTGDEADRWKDEMKESGW
jgi:hypothetical protein